MTLIPRQSVWRFLNYATDERRAWREAGPETPPTHYGLPWKTGKAPFGYALPGLAAGMNTTTRRESMRYQNTTVYFRRVFQVERAEDYAELKVRLIRDGGAAVYINGREVVRSNLANDAAFDTLAKRKESKLSLFAPYVYLVDPSVLQSGQNVIAVEVHQDEIESTDMAFDLALEARLKR